MGNNALNTKQYFAQINLPLSIEYMAILNSASSIKSVMLRTNHDKRQTNDLVIIFAILKI